LLFSPLTAFAYSDYVIPGGENIGMEIHAKGIIVAGTYEVDGVSPALEAKLKIGDLIIKIDDHQVHNVNDLQEIINRDTDKKLEITYIRNGVTEKTTLYLVKSKSDGIYKTGLYVKSSVAGIGTITFIDPETKKFGALGHEIVDSSSKEKIEVHKGTIFEANVIGIDRSKTGKPGEKNARFNTNQVLGNIKKNTPYGVFGDYIGKLPDKVLMKVSDISEVKPGPAKIYTVIDGKKVEAFDIEILKVYTQKTMAPKGLLFEITDEKLLKKTGGIVQGMSGSPIVQDDKLVGAVTHVLINKVNKGYGIHIKWMMEEAHN
jgi:stage IV sporulation protein B